MAQIIRVPRVSDLDEKVKVLDIYLRIGDYVKPGDIIASFEGEMMIFEIAAESKGRVIYSTLWPKRKYETGEVILMIGEDWEDPQQILDQAEADEKMPFPNPPSDMGKVIVEGMEFEIADLLDLRFGITQLLGMELDADTEAVIERIKSLKR